MAAIDAIDDLLHHAPRGRFADVRWIDETALRDASAHLRRVVGAEAYLLTLVDRVDALSDAGKRKGGRVGVPPERLYDLLDRLRFGVGREFR